MMLLLLTKRACSAARTLLLVAALSAPFGCAAKDDENVPAEVPATSSEPETVWFRDVAVERGLVFVHDSGYRKEFLFPETACGGAGLFDMDGDGDLDAYLVQAGNLLEPASKRRGNQLFRNDGKGNFTNVTAGSGTEDRGYGMGVAAGDYDNDGDNDLYVSNLDTNALLRNDGDGKFTDVAREAGVALETYGASCGFLDYDRDGDLDLFIANYLVWTPENEQICYSNRGTRTYGGPNLYSPVADTLFRNNGDGTFTDVSREAGLWEHFGNGLGTVFGDIDDDGDVDILMLNRDLQASLLLNVATPLGNWIQFRVLERHGRDAVGAVLRITMGDRMIRRDVKSVYSYCAANDPRVHIGLGDATRVDSVHVRWPTGEEQNFGAFEANQTHTLEQDPH